MIKDSSPYSISKITGFFGTCFLWIVFLICMILIKPAKKPPKYKEVQIVLESARVEEKKVADAKAVAEVATPERKVNTPAAPAKPAPVEDSWDDFEYALDPMEAFAQQTATTEKKAVDWDEMFGEEVSTAEATVSGGKVIGGNEFSGSVGKASGSGDTRVKSAQAGGRDRAGGQTENLEASRATSTALGDILNTRFVGSSGAALESATTVAATTGDNGKVFIKMSNGRARALITPAEPGIKLSREAEAAIDGSKSVKIRFMVMKNGNVPSSQIKITPEALLPAIVQQEIREQLSKWLFESDNYDAFAEFEYNIVKK